jgi:hypothetical protein
MNNSLLIEMEPGGVKQHYHHRGTILALLQKVRDLLGRKPQEFMIAKTILVLW